MSGKVTPGPAPPSYQSVFPEGYNNPAPQFNTNYGVPQPQTMYGARYGVPTYPTAGIGVGVQNQAPVRDYTTHAYIACACCFWPTGLLAIMKANQSRAALSRGDIEGARIASDGARTMVRISWAAGIVSILISVGLLILYIVVIIPQLYNHDYDDYDD